MHAATSARVGPYVHFLSDSQISDTLKNHLANHTLSLQSIRGTIWSICCSKDAFTVQTGVFISQGCDKRTPHIRALEKQMCFLTVLEARNLRSRRQQTSFFSLSLCHLLAVSTQFFFFCVQAARCLFVCPNVILQHTSQTQLGQLQWSPFKQVTFLKALFPTTVAF